MRNHRIGHRTPQIRIRQVLQYIVAVGICRPLRNPQGGLIRDTQTIQVRSLHFHFRGNFFDPCTSPMNQNHPNVQAP